MENQEWKTDTNYKKDDRVTCNNQIFLCFQDHGSNVYWIPGVARTLWQIQASPESRAGGCQTGLALELEP